MPHTHIQPHTIFFIYIYLKIYVGWGNYTYEKNFDLFVWKSDMGRSDFLSSTD